MDALRSNMDRAPTPRFDDCMTNSSASTQPALPTVLVLGGTGKTGRRIVERLRAAGATARPAARSGADVRFDWDDIATHDAALRGVDAVYLVPPALRLDHAPAVAAFLDRAAAAGVRHVTYLSARGVDQAPPELALRAIELDLAAHADLTHAVLRPGWFLQNFSEGFFAPSADGVIVAPTGDGREAFVHADDIAEVAVATVLDPAAHAGAGYELTGPEARSFADVAASIAAATGRPVRHVDVERDAWVAQAVAGGVPADYAELLGGLLDGVRAGHGAATTDDVERVTGHRARGLAELVADPAALDAWSLVGV
jgi:uncharacterized protein YbjT (DUF2867 family)